jgi:hypothetical protein
MLLKPLSTNAFYAALFLGVAVVVSTALAEPVFGPLFETPSAQHLLRTFVVPIVSGS